MQTQFYLLNITELTMKSHFKTFLFAKEQKVCYNYICKALKKIK